MITQQQFDVIVEGIRSQGGPSRDDSDGNCLYRAPSGRKCAIGWLIDDDLYDPAMDASCTWNGEWKLTKLVKKLGIPLTWREAHQLQDMHDVASMLAWPGSRHELADVFFYYFEQDAEKFATKHHLEYKPPPPAPKTAYAIAMEALDEIGCWELEPAKPKVKAKVKAKELELELEPA